MKKKITIIIVAVVIVAILAAVIIPMLTKKKSEDNAEIAVTEDSGSLVNGAADVIKESDSATDKDNTVSDTDATSDTKTDAGGSVDGQGTDGSGYNSGGGGGGVGQLPSSDQESESTTSEGQASNTQPSNTQTSSIPTISFPYAIPGTDLVIEQISAYTGYFIEDASDTEISDIAAIVLKNNGEALEFVGIGISQGTRSLAFSASQIPSGGTVIIQEQNGAAFASDPYYSATATTQTTEKLEMSEDKVSVKDNGNNSFTVTNITDKKLSEVKVYFKNYLPDENVYVGGITYNVTLNDIEVGTEVDVTANHYDSKYSVIVEVVVY